MQTLSIFPDLLFLGPSISPLILRIIVGLFILYLAYDRKHKEYNYLYVINGITGIALFLGIYTQLAVILGLVLIKLDFYLNYWKSRNINPVSIERYFLYFFAGVILVSLLFTGPGGFSFDLPL
jgi:hypothetical protein